MSFTLTISIAPEWERIEQTRQAVSDGLRAALCDVEISETVAMVVAELLENAVKYRTQPNETVRVQIACQTGRVVASVTNPIDSSGAQALIERIAWLNGFSDPAAAFAASLRNSTRTSCGIGLARVLYEGDCRLECDTSEAGVITVRAVSNALVAHPLAN
jgi:hypothetical protein